MGCRLILLIMFLAIGCGPLHAQGISLLRTIAGYGFQWGTAMDATGVYVTALQGRRAGGAGPGPGVLRKFDKGGEELWSRQFPANINPGAVAVTAGAVYVSGLATEGTGMFVGKYDPDGGEQWARQFEAYGNYWGGLADLAADDTGVYVITRTGDNRIEATDRGVIRKYDPDGRELWTRLVNEFIVAVAASDSAVYVVGFEPHYGGLPSWFVRKYDLRGAELWTRPVEFPGWGFLTVAGDATGVYVATQTHLSKYSSSGAELWTRSFPAFGNYGMVRGLAADGSGAYVAGSITGSLAGHCSAGGEDAFVLKYDLEGNEVWTRQFGTRFSNYPGRVALDATGVYLAGSDGANGFLAKLEKASEVLAHSRPRISWECVVNAGSYEGGGVAPGEIVAIFGSALGPAQLTPGRITGEGRLAAELAGVRVLFNGVPAPLLHVSANQIGAIVPYSIAPAPSVDVQVEYQGLRSDAVRVPLLPARPGFFLTGAPDTGGGGYFKGAVIFNEDGSLNSSANPARRGSVLSMYLTGEGRISPSVPDGAILSNTLPSPTQRVSVEFVSLDDELWPFKAAMADVLHAGGVSGSVAGLLQIKVRVPPEVDTTWSEEVFVGVSIGSERTGAEVAVR